MIKRNPMAVLLIVLGGLLLLTPALAQDDEETYSEEMVADGKLQFELLCASCHGNYSAAVVGNLTGPDLRNNEYVQTSEDFELFNFIVEGRPLNHPDNQSGVEMPARGGNPQLPDTAIVNIIAYVRSLQGIDVTALEVETPEPVNDSPYQWELVVDKIDNPLLLAHDPRGRLYVGEQAGFILVIRGNDYLDEPFLDISRLVPRNTYSGGYSEQGLLGLAFHPNDRTQFFVSYINTAGNSVLARYRVDPSNPNRADPNSATILLTVDQPYEDHNGGNLAFGPDGYLYMAFGDGGRPSQPNYFSQEPNLFLGKMIRLDVDAASNDRPYAIPTDNPFVDNPDFLPEIWAFGLRNPWRFSFDRQTGDLYIADVGQWILEELNFQPADSTGGQNYGWSAYEGTQRYLEDETALGEVTFPVMEYAHDEGCSITGGYVYRGEMLHDLQGKYIFGDYCSGNVWTAEADAAGVWDYELLMATPFVIASFGEDATGELYVVDYKGAVYRLTGAQ